jgi:hypothetical protein
MVVVWVSAAGVSTKDVQLLVAFAKGGIVPVQVTVTVCPMLEGTVTLVVPGFDALTANRSRATPATAKTPLRVARAVFEAEFFFIMNLSEEKAINRSARRRFANPYY